MPSQPTVNVRCKRRREKKRSRREETMHNIRLQPDKARGNLLHDTKVKSGPQRKQRASTARTTRVERQPALLSQAAQKTTEPYLSNTTIIFCRTHGSSRLIIIASVDWVDWRMDLLRSAKAKYSQAGRLELRSLLSNPLFSFWNLSSAERYVANETLS